MAPLITPAFVSSLGASVTTITAASTSRRLCLTSNFTGLRVGVKQVKPARLGAASVSAIATDVTTLQSPVNVPINGTESIPVSNAPVITEATDVRLSREFEEENGNYRMNASNAGAPAAGSIVFQGLKYNLEQLHVHNRSEHRLEGRDFPIEMHLVHMRKPDGPNDMRPAICVLALFVDFGPFNTEFDKVLDGMEIESKEVSVDVVSMLGRGLEQRQLVTLIGSTTTPPFTRNVQWIISQEVIKVAPEQVIRYQNIDGVRVPNNRVLQNVQGRSFTRYF